MSWEVKAEYYWGSGYHNDHNGYRPEARVGGAKLRLRDRNGADPDGRAFSFTPGLVDGSSNLRFDTVIDRPEPGTHALSHLTGTEKTGGYWWSPNTPSGYDVTDAHRWCRPTIDTASTATITLA